MQSQKSVLLPLESEIYIETYNSQFVNFRHLGLKIKFSVFNSDFENLIFNRRCMELNIEMSFFFNLIVKIDILIFKLKREKELILKQFRF